MSLVKWFDCIRFECNRSRQKRSIDQKFNCEKKFNKENYVSLNRLLDDRRKEWVQKCSAIRIVIIYRLWMFECISHIFLKFHRNRCVNPKQTACVCALEIKEMCTAKIVDINLSVCLLNCAVRCINAPFMCAVCVSLNTWNMRYIMISIWFLLKILFEVSCVRKLKFNCV